MKPVIILDFDGVILESVDIKTEAFRQLFSFSPEHVDEIVRFHIKNGGMSRFDKFRHIYTDILHEPLSDEKFQQLSDKFSDLVERAVKHAPFIMGVQKFLCSSSEKYTLYIVSATPEDELKRIVAEKGLSSQFTAVYGSPTKKVEHIRRILTQNTLSPKEVLFVGDALNDLSAARECGIRFIGRVRQGDLNIFQDQPGVEWVISDFFDLIRYLESM